MGGKDFLGILWTLFIVLLLFAGAVWAYRKPKGLGRGTGAFGLVKVVAKPDGSIVSIELSPRSLEEGPYKLSMELLVAIKRAQEEAKAQNPPGPGPSTA